jgi:hypothetical protein
MSSAAARPRFAVVLTGAVLARHPPAPDLAFMAIADALDRFRRESFRRPRGVRAASDFEPAAAELIPGRQVARCLVGVPGEEHDAGAGRTDLLSGGGKWLAGQADQGQPRAEPECLHWQGRATVADVAARAGRPCQRLEPFAEPDALPGEPGTRTCKIAKVITLIGLGTSILAR